MGFGRIGAVLGIVLLCFFGASDDVITGDVVATGEAVSDNVTISIAVVNFPALNIVSPKNETYISNSVFLNYLVGYSNYLWYNVDGAQNVSIGLPTTLFLENGSHVISLYAENDYGVAREDVWFTIDTDKLDVRYDNFYGTSGGSSTDFDSFSFEELRNLSDVVLERVEFGRIDFSGIVDVVGDLNASDRVVDLDRYVVMSNGAISVDVIQLPNFDVSSVVSFFNLGMVSPRVLEGNDICAPDVCMNKTYIGGVLTFDAVRMGEYNVVETYVAPSTSTSSSGGGSSVTTVSYEDEIDAGFLITEFDRMSVSVRQGEIKTREILVTNDGSSSLNFEVVSSGFEGLIVLDEYRNVVLSPGESKTLYIDISVGENVSVDNYFGKLFFRGKDVAKEVLLSIFVESMFGLFDVEVEIVQGGEILFPGDYFVAEVDIVNLGEPKRRQVVISYFLKSDDDEVLFLEEEVGIIDTQLVLPKTFRIPEEFVDGDYVLYVNVEHEGRVTGGSDWFEVRGVGFWNDPLFFWGILIGILSILLWWILFTKKRRKKGRPQ